MVTTMSRGNSIRLKGLPKSIQTKFRRAVALTGARSQSAWLSTMIRKLIREQEAKYGDLMAALTPDEVDIVEVVQNGANDPEHIAEETLLSAGRLDLMLFDLVERDILEVRRQGGKTEAARGARRPLYFVSEKYQSKTE